VLSARNGGGDGDSIKEAAKCQLRPPSPSPLILLPDMFSEDCWRERWGSLATVSWED
jgi:hypothetical protein